MAFHEVRFPEDIAYGAEGGPEYRTDIVTLANGYEQRSPRWQTARARYNIAHGIKSQSQMHTLMAFYRARQGRAHGFRFKDWADFNATAQNVGTGNGATTIFQLKKHYTSGSITETRLITKPVNGSVSIYVNSILQSSGVSLNTSTGEITFSVAPTMSAVITADFQFDVPVRFEEDALGVRWEAPGGFLLPQVRLVEIRI